MNKKTKLILTLSILLFSLGLVRHASALTCNDQADGNWNSAGTWSCGVIPDADDDVTIDSHTVTITATSLSNSVTISGGTLNMGSYTHTNDSGWTYTSGTVDAGTSTLKFTATLTFTPGNVEYYNFEWAGGWGPDELTISGTATVTNNLTISVDYGTAAMFGGVIAVQGNIYNTISNYIGQYTTTLIKINGTGDQTISSTGGGSYGSIEIDKPSGVLTMIGTINSQGNWTHTSGTVNAGTSTLRFSFNSTSRTFTPGSVDYYNLVWQNTHGSWGELLISGTAIVTNNFTNSSGDVSDYVKSGTIEVRGDVNITHSVASGASWTTLIKINGAGDQTISSTGGGSYGPIEIDKPSGTLTMGGNIWAQGNWIWTRGLLDAGTYKLSFDRPSTFTPGNAEYYNVQISGNTVTLGGYLKAVNELRIAGGTFPVGSYTITTKDFVQTGGTINMGSGAMKITGNFTRSGGTFTQGTSVVAFQGENQTINVTGAATTFYKLYKLINEADTLTITAGNTIVIAASGVMRFWGKPEGETLSIVSSSPGTPYTITRTGTAELEYTNWSDASWSAAQTAAASTLGTGNTNLTVTKEFISTIRATGGDYSTLSGWESAVNCDLTAATTKVFSHGGITGTIADNSAVSGETSGATATAVHTTSTQILLKSIAVSTFQSGEKVWLDSDHNNYVILSDAGYGAIATAHPYNDWPSGLSESVDVLIDGWTTGSNNYVKIYVPINERHDGWAWTDANKNVYSGFAVKFGNWNEIRDEEQYTWIEGLIVHAIGTDNSLIYIVGDGNALVKNNIVISKSGNYVAIRVVNTTSTNDKYTKIIDNVVYDAPVGISVGTYATAYIYNNAVVDNTTGININGDSYTHAKLKNNLAHSNTTDFSFGTYNTLSNDYSASSDDTADDQSGAGNRINQTFTFKDENNDDFHLLTGDEGARNHGTDLSVDATYPVIDDIDGESRLGLDPNGWDIGADEFIPTIAATTGGSADTSASPIAYWNFNEGYGDTAYNNGSGSGIDGTLQSGGSGTNDTNTKMWDKNGKFATAMEFDGTNDYVELGDKVEPSSMTIAAWVKFDSVATNKRIVSKWGNEASERSYVLSTDDASSNELSFAVETDAVSIDVCDSLASTGTYTTGQWYFLVGTYNGTTCKLYKNTIDVTDLASDTASGAIQNTATSLRIGEEGDGTAGMYFDGLIDEVKIYDYALSEDQVKKEYNQGMAMQIGEDASRSSSGATVTGAAKDYCIPGDTAYCAPPVGEWKMEQNVSGASQTLYDTSGNGNDGTTYSANGTGMDCRNNGKVGFGCQFDGVDDYVDIENDSSLNITGDISLSAWFYAKALPSSNAIIYHRSVPNNETKNKEITVVAGKARTGFSKADGSWDGTTLVSGSTSIQTGQWYHVVGVGKANNYMKIYVNGMEDGSKDISWGFAAGDKDWVIGRVSADYGAWYFPGLIDQVRIYNYVRTPAQIAWEYNQGKPVAHWRFDECTGSDIHDESGNGNDGTIELGAGGVTATGTCSASANTFWYNGRTGKYGAAGSFDGTDDYVDLPADDGAGTILGLDRSTFTDGTISLWFNPSSVTTAQALFSASDSGDTLSALQLEIATTGGKIQFFLWENLSGVLQFTIDDALVANNWYHVAVVIDGNGNKAYLNGSEAAVTYSYGNASTQAFFDTVNDIDFAAIGIRKTNGTFLSKFSGKIDDVKVFNYALAATQIKNLYNDGAVRF